ncbi:MBL fold metallo-hydrolase [Cellulophaga sp. F20128]|uniref:MBL fold metallo-hydrolase n=1 Tax=Cellulophaga sp. F20128 TaxID=2926413 RepID=UPI001FF6FA06|nr:MBL fold metallo-hydrolase [Cellulophaga sp. F20128]MCK0156648.1 MBL fold metallo-hydrolase [Cellulophaga sp. F20128]
MKTTIYILSVCVFTLMSCKDKKETTEDIAIEPIVTEEIKAQADLKIIPIEHATLVLEWGETTVYVDPIGGAEAFAGQKQPDLILITDIHGDHFSVETLQALNTSKAKIIVPQAVADKIPSEFTPQLDILSNGESKERYGITVTAIPMYNLREEALKFHEKGRGNGYLVTKGDERIYFSGDTEDIPEMRALQNIDKAFICMNLPYTMTEESAASAVLEFKPKQVYPYHYRGKPDVSDVSQFKKLVNEGDSSIEVIQLDWYPKNDY